MGAVMAKDYDATMKSMVDLSPADWLALAGRPPAPVTAVDADNSVVMSGAVDKLLRVHADPEYLLRLDFQAGHDSAQLPRRLKLYNAVQEYKYNLAVLSVAVLLHPRADSPQLTGLCERTLPGEGGPYSWLRYRVVRVWQLPVERVFAGGAGLLSLAPISNVSQAEVPDVIRRMRERLGREEHGKAADIWASTFILLSLRYSEAFAETMIDIAMQLTDSPGYQLILRRGQVEEARKILLLQGTLRFGAPDDATRAVLDALTDLPKLEQLSARLLGVSSWQELVGAP